MSKYDLPFLNDKTPIKNKIPKGAETKRTKKPTKKKK